MDAKDVVIEQLIAENQALKETIKALRETIRQLEEKIARLEKNSHNSSKPSSSDIVKPQKKSIQKRSGRKRKQGGQWGHRK